MSSFVRDHVSPPGSTLEEMLEERELTQVELSKRLGVTPKHVNQVLSGNAAISADLAVRLESVLGVPARFWISRESNYRAALAKQERDERWLSDVDWAKSFPIGDLKKFHLIDSNASGVGLVVEVSRFLGIASPDRLEEVAVAYRSTNCFDSDRNALQAWLRWGSLKAFELDAAPFDHDAFETALKEIRTFTVLPPEKWFDRLVQLCAEAGVCTVLTPTFQGVRATGAAWWVSQHRAILQLSNRHKWEDVFWFSFFHEAGHILMHRKKQFFLEPEKRKSFDNADEKLVKLEHEADLFAARMLIPEPFEDELAQLSLDKPKTVVAFANRIGVAPAIVVGRLQHQNRQFSKGNNLRRRFEIKSVVD